MFDPYGKVTVLDGNGTPRTVNESAYGNPWTFTGRRLDGETGLMYYRNRMYETGLGRFCQRDPIGYVDGWQLYEYVGNHPCLFADPYGLKRCCVESFSVRQFGWYVEFAQSNIGGGFSTFGVKYRTQDGTEKYIGTEDLNSPYLNNQIIRYQAKMQVDAQFVEDGDCCFECCEYRQYISKGYEIGGNYRDPNYKYLAQHSSETEDTGTDEEGKVLKYGYRNGELWDPGNMYYPDAKKGGRYQALDHPGLKAIPLSKWAEYNKSFMGVIIDVCNQKNTVARITWNIYISVRKPNGISPPKDSPNVLEQRIWQSD